jgi:hypothetical protein
MIEDWSGSSIDGSLDDGGDLDPSQFRFFEVNQSETKTTDLSRSKTLDATLVSNRSSSIYGKSKGSDSTNKNSVHNSQSIVESSSSKDVTSLMIPGCIRLNKMLTQAGYSPIELASGDIDLGKRTISVFIIDAWAESLAGCFAELMEQQLSHKASVEAASFDMNLSGVSQNALHSQLSNLQQKLEGTERKEKISEQKLSTVGEFNSACAIVSFML